MAYPYAAAVEASLEQVAEMGVDPMPLVYDKVFAAHPDMRSLFWRDDNGSIRGEMLSRVFAAILDFVGERRYADHMIGTEMVTHEGYDVPREIFITFFATVGEAIAEILGEAWTGEMAAAWREMLADVEAYAARTPRSDISTVVFEQFRAEAERRVAEQSG